MRQIVLVPMFAFLAVGLSTAAAENLPLTPAETLTGQKLVFPAALAGKPAVCVFGFSKEGGDRAKEWMMHLNQDKMNAWSIANLEGAPALIRGMIRGSMRKGTPPAMLERSLIMTKDEQAWRRALGARVDNLPVVVLFDAAGRIVWRYEGRFSDEPYREMKARLELAIKAAGPPFLLALHRFVASY